MKNKVGAEHLIDDLHTSSAQNLVAEAANDGIVGRHYNLLLKKHESLKTRQLLDD
jgi:hypothetical protein